MDATESIVDLDGAAMQAWKEDGMEATRRKAEARLIEERQRQLGRIGWRVGKPALGAVCGAKRS